MKRLPQARIPHSDTRQCSFSTMLPEALSWLNVDFVEKMLKTSENDESIKVQSLETKFATSAGDNYSSAMIRASVEYSQKKLGSQMIERKSIIFKVGPIEDGPMKQIISEMRCFETESEIMTTTLPKMNDLLEMKDSRLGARILYANTKHPPTIAMEDLAPLGYRMADRQAGLDLEHCIVAMRALAKFHASSVALYEKDPTTMSRYNNDINKKDTPELTKRFLAKEITSFAKALLEWTELGSSASSYSQKLIKIADAYSDGRLEYNKPTNPGVFNVLNHGDCWVNNMLFRYNDEGKVIDHIFVDFQGCTWNDPAIDLINFLSTSLSEDVDCHHRDRLLDEYLNHLTEIMTQLGLNTKPPNMTALKETLSKNGLLAIIPSCVGLPIILQDKSNVKSIDEIMQETADNVNPMYTTPALRKRLPSRLYAWRASGMLDL